MPNVHHLDRAFALVEAFGEKLLDALAGLDDLGGVGRLNAEQTARVHELLRDVGAESQAVAGAAGEIIEKVNRTALVRHYLGRAS